MDCAADICTPLPRAAKLPIEHAGSVCRQVIFLAQELTNVIGENQSRVQELV